MSAQTLLTNPDSIRSWMKMHADTVKQQNSNSALLVQYVLNRLHELYCLGLHSGNALQMRQEIFIDLQRAYRADNSFAMFLYGLALKTGFGCEQPDVAAGKALILIAAKVGLCSDALNYMGQQQYKYNPQAAVKLFASAAERGHKNACRNLGIAYLYGNGVEQSYAQAINYFKQAEHAAANLLLAVREHIRLHKLQRAQQDGADQPSPRKYRMQLAY